MLGAFDHMHMLICAIQILIIIIIIINGSDRWSSQTTWNFGDKFSQELRYQEKARFYSNWPYKS